MRRKAFYWMALAAGAATAAPPAQEGDHLLRNFRFAGGATLPELRLHYTTLGQPTRDASGYITNAVLIMHGTGGNGKALLDRLAEGPLFGPGDPLDTARYYLVFPDAIGHGKSSKPSDGLRAKFPAYRYADMVRAQHALLTEGLKIRHLRLVMGTSMGGMHTWLWGEMYPDFMDALMPLASAPVEIAGRNRMFRAMVSQAIREDPAWKKGNYKKPPAHGLIAANYALWMMGTAPLRLHETNATPAAADAAIAKLRKDALTRADANDMLYAFESSLGYNPAPLLQTIRAPLVAVNSADDEVNPPELGILEREIAKVPRGRYVLIPIGPKTRGHGSHSVPQLWANHVRELLDPGK